MTVTLPDARRISTGLQDQGFWRDIRVVESTGSTNADVAELARQGHPGGLVLVACEQTAGRGRRARSWHSPFGSSVSISLLVEPRPTLDRWGWLSLLAGLSVAEALDELGHGSPSVELKWPNDVLLDGRKVCGILSEHVDQPHGPKAVVGLGINISLTREQLPVPTATSLLLEGMPTDPNRVVIAVLDRFVRHFRQWQSDGGLREEYSRRCTSVGRELTITVSETESITGIGRGVDEFGRLQVDSGGATRTYAAGDVVHASLDGGRLDPCP